MIMKRKNSFMFLASVMLVAMSFASCKMSNLEANAEKELYAIPADGAAMFGPESYHLHDYGFFFNNFKQNVADRVAAFLNK